MLKVKGLTLVRDNLALLQDINFELATGDSLAIIGGENSGKSILLSCLAGLETAFSGKILSSGQAALVLANPENQFVSFSVEQELAFSLENLAMPISEIDSRIQKTLRDFNLFELANHPPALLSGGEKQRAVLASMLITQPELLLLDDPCSMLDDKAKKELLTLIFRSGVKQIVLATGNTEESLFCSHLLVLSAGKICFFGRTESVYLEHFRAILAMNLDLPLSILQKVNKIGI